MTADAEEKFEGGVLVLAFDEGAGDLVVEKDHPIVEFVRAHFFNGLLTFE